MQYASSLEHIPVSRERMNNNYTELSDSEKKTEYKSPIGQLNWIATQTRPDVEFEVCELS